MPDITMCQGLNVSTNTMCPQRESCHRFTAIPTPHWQSYFVDAPFESPAKCSHFWPIDIDFKQKKKVFNANL